MKEEDYFVIAYLDDKPIAWLPKRWPEQFDLQGQVLPIPVLQKKK